MCSWPLSRRMPSRCSRPRIGAGLPVLRQRVAERAVGEAELETVDHLRVTSRPRFQVLERLGLSFSKSRGRSRHDCASSSSVPASAFEGRGSFSVQLVFTSRSPLSGAAVERSSALQQLDRMPEAHPLAFITQSMLTRPPGTPPGSATGSSPA